MSQQRHRTSSDIYAPAPAAGPAFILVDLSTGQEIALPARLKCWDGAEIVVRDFKPSRFEGNEGYIYTTMNETYVPSVVGAKIVAVAP